MPSEILGVAHRVFPKSALPQAALSFAKREAERASPPGIEAENNRLITAHRVENAASPSGNVQTACMWSGRTTQASI